MRHGAVKEGLNISSEGFIDIKEILSHKSLRHYTAEDIERIVRNNDKQRFTLREKEGALEIRANQGHSLNVSHYLTIITFLYYSLIIYLCEDDSSMVFEMTKLCHAFFIIG